MDSSKSLSSSTPRYKLLGRNYFIYTEIPKINTKTRDGVSGHLKETDQLWTSRTADTFMSVSLHYITKSWEVHSWCSGIWRENKLNGTWTFLKWQSWQFTKHPITKKPPKIITHDHHNLYIAVCAVKASERYLQSLNHQSSHANSPTGRALTPRTLIHTCRTLTHWKSLTWSKDFFWAAANGTWCLKIGTLQLINIKRSPWTSESFYRCSQWWEARNCLTTDVEDTVFSWWWRQWFCTCCGNERFNQGKSLAAFRWWGVRAAFERCHLPAP